MKRPPAILEPWQWAAGSAIIALVLAGLIALGRWWRRQRRRQDFLNFFEAKMRRAIHEGVDARAELKNELFQFEDLQQLEPQAYQMLGKEAGALVSQVLKNFEDANLAIKSVVRQRRTKAVKLQSVMWKEDLRTRIEGYSEVMAPFLGYEKNLDEIVNASRNHFFNG